jgi:hypothetical protein
MGSAGHRQNLLSASYHEIGIGVASDGSRNATFWTQDFGARREIPQVEVPSPAPAEDETAPPAPDSE